MKRNTLSKNPNLYQEELVQPEPKPKNANIKASELTQDIAIFKSAIDAYRDMIIFYQWIIWLFIAATAGFGVFIWRKYKNFTKETIQRLSDFQQNAEEEAKALRSRIEKETMQIEITGKIFIGVSLVSQGKIQDAIPYLNGALKYKEVLTNEQLLIIHFTLGNIYSDIGNIPLAITQAKEAINVDQNLALVRFLMARALQLSGDYNSALDEIKIAKDLAIAENYTPENLARIYILHGNILIQAKKYEEAEKKLEEAKKMIEEVMLKMPLGSPQWFTRNQAKIEAQNGIENIEIRKFLIEKYKSEPSQEEVINVFTWMKLLPFANKIGQVYQIFEDKDFITVLKKVFDELLSRPPQAWEILRYGDKWLAKKQEEKDINEIIKEELVKYPEYVIKKESEEKYKKLLK